MKKVIIALLLLLCVITMPTVSAKPAKTTTTKEVNNDVKIYLFFASWCSHCHDFINYFSDKYMNYTDSFEIVAYRVDENTVNSNLMAEVGSAMGRDGSGIPFIVIGDWYQSGFGTDGSNLIEKAIAAKTDKNYKDVVADTIKSKNLSSDPMEFSEAVKLISSDSGETENQTSTESSNDTLIVVIVFAVIVLGFGGLFLYSRKN